MNIKYEVMDPYRLKEARPDLWPIFIQILKEEAPDYHKMFVADPVIYELLKTFEGSKLTVEIKNLPQRAQDLIFKATAEAIERMKQNEKNQ